MRPPGALEEKILRQRTGIEGERKLVTVMYADIAGSMALTRALDDERYGFVLDRFLAIAAGTVHKFEGTVNQFTGDGLLAVFGAPLAHSDHARRACLTALELQSRAASLGAELSQSDEVEFAIRCGLNSGEVVVGAIGDDVHMDFVPIGNTTALGKRIESIAPVGSTAISGSTAALVEGEFELRDLGDFELKGVDGRQRVLELVGPGTGRTRLEATAATRGLSPFVGREAELGELEAGLDRAQDGEGQAIAVVGDPGVGKSRLVREFVAGCAARGVKVNSAAGVSHGCYTPFMPVLALYRDYFGIDELDAPEAARERIEATLLDLDPGFAADLPLMFEFLGVPDPDRPHAQLDPEASRSRLLDLLARDLEARGREKAGVLVLEDLHWIDDASAAILERLMQAVAGTHVVLIATFRPEYEAEWAAGGQRQIRLEPLGRSDAGALLAELLGPDPSLDGLSAMIEARAGGNPFFIEEIVQTLAEAGHLAGARGGYRLAAELDALVLPPSVQAGLAERIDRLPSREKALVQTMAVIGAEIPEALLSAVSDLNGPELAEAVDELAGAQMVLPQGSSSGTGFVFKHPMTQDVAYGSQLSEQRGRTHDMVAAAIETTYPDELDERAALLAHHWEAAGDKLRAATWHARAAAWAQVASPADGMRHWRRVIDLANELEDSPECDELAGSARTGILKLAWRLGISPEEIDEISNEAGARAERVRLDPHYAGFLMHNGRELEGLEEFQAINRHAVAAGDLGLALTASTGVGYVAWIAGSLKNGMETIDEALQLTSEEPKAGAGEAFVCPLAHAYSMRAVCRGNMGQVAEAQGDFDRAIELAREYGDAETEAAAHANRAQLEAESGDHGAAVDSAALGLALAERAANAIHIIACTTPTAVADAGAGRFDAALAQAQSNLDEIRQRQIGLYFEPMLLATIARSKLGLGAPEEALAAAEEGAEIMETRGLRTCAMQAPLALAEVLTATRGDGAALRIGKVLARAAHVAQAAGARNLETRLHAGRPILDG